MYPAIASLLLGVTGWLVTSFFAKPLLDFLNLRSQVLEELIFTANIDDETMPLYGTARESLRRLGAKVLATNSTASRLLRRFLPNGDTARGGGWQFDRALQFSKFAWSPPSH